jgi:sulfur-carrier protein
VIRVVLPAGLRALAQVQGELEFELPGQPTAAALIDALEARYPMLRGTIRDHTTRKRRAYLRFFACQKDLSHDGLDAPLPPAVVAGSEPFVILGAISGG